MKKLTEPTIEDYNKFVELLNMAFSRLRLLTNDVDVLADMFIKFDKKIFDKFFRPFTHGKH